jgi:hypothetical protein
MYIVIIQFILTCPISCTMIYSDEINQIKSNYCMCLKILSTYYYLLMPEPIFVSLD